MRQAHFGRTCGIGGHASEPQLPPGLPRLDVGAATRIRFVFPAGGGDFPKADPFPRLNNLDDITPDRCRAATCGRTDGDIDTVFASGPEDLDREMIRHRYYGCSRPGEGGIHNPFGILRPFDERAFENHRFGTGAPTFPVETPPSP